MTNRKSIARQAAAKKAAARRRRTQAGTDRMWFAERERIEARHRHYQRSKRGQS
jgi:hypothetical protein